METNPLCAKCGEDARYYNPSSELLILCSTSANQIGKNQS
jgi:hypothetical protein